MTLVIISLYQNEQKPELLLLLIMTNIMMFSDQKDFIGFILLLFFLFKTLNEVYGLDGNNAMFS